MSFGLKSIGKPTPAWVKKALIIVHLLLAAISGYCYASTLIPENIKQELLLITGGLGTFFTAIAPMFDTEKISTDNDEGANNIT